MIWIFIFSPLPTRLRLCHLKLVRDSNQVLSDFFCDSCDRGYKSAELLAEHVASHETCGRDGCKFTAQPKVVLKHVQMQHDTGLYLRIRTESPEDVAKWIAERKNRFPTKEHIESRLAQRREMFERGERISTRGRPFFNRNQRGNWRENYNNRNSEISPHTTIPSPNSRRDAPTTPSLNSRRDAPTTPSLNSRRDALTTPSLNSRNDAPTIPSLNPRKDVPTIPSLNSRKDAPTIPSLNSRKDAPTIPSLNSRVALKPKITSSEINKRDRWRDFHCWRGDLPKFPGTASFLSLEEDNTSCKEEQLQISDEEETAEIMVETPNAVKPVVSGVLAALMADYGSDMTEEEDEDESSSKSNVVAEIVEKIPKVDNKNTTLDKHKHVDKEDVQMQVSYDQQKSFRIMENSKIPDQIKQYPEEHIDHKKDTCQIPFAADTIKPVEKQSDNKSETISRHNFVNSSIIADKIKEDSEEHIDHKKDTCQIPFEKPADDTIKPVEKQSDNKSETISRHNFVDSSIIADKIKEDSDSGPEEQKIDHKDTSEVPVPKPAEDSVKPVKRTSGNEPSKMSRPLPARHRPPRHQLSLLEKLLGNEIRQERNMILQCVRFVVKNNFFDRETVT